MGLGVVAQGDADDPGLGMLGDPGGVEGLVRTGSLAFGEDMNVAAIFVHLVMVEFVSDGELGRDTRGNGVGLIGNGDLEGAELVMAA